MADKNEVVIKISGDSKGAVEAIKQVKQAIEQSQKAIKADTQSLDEMLGIKPEQTRQKIGAIQRAMNGLGDTLRSLGSGGTTAFNFLDGAFNKIVNLKNAVLGFAAFKTFNLLTGEAQKVENALTGLRSVAKNTFQDLSEVEQVARNLSRDGLIPLADSAAAVKNLLASGLNIDQTNKLLTVFKDAAAFGRQGSLSLGEAVRGSTEGFKNQLSTLLDNGGITKNISVIQKEYAATIGKTYEELTEAEKVQGLYNGLLKEGAIFAGDAAKLTNTYSGAISQLKSSFTQAAASLGDYIIKNQVFIEGIKGASFFFDLINVTKKQSSATKELAEAEAALAEQRAFINENGGINEFSKKELERRENDVKAAKEKVEQEKRQKTNVLAEKEAQDLINISKTYSAERLAIEQKLTSDLEKEKAGRAELDKKAAKEKQKRDKEAVREAKTELANLLREQSKVTQALGEGQKSPLSAVFGGTKAQMEISNVISNLEQKKAKNDNPEVEKLLNKQLKEAEKLSEQINKSALLGASVGTIGQILQGSAGAKNLLSEGIGGGIGALAGNPALGQALTPIIQQLMAGPDATREMVKGFTDAIPDLIEALIDAVPVLIEELANQSPLIIERLADKAPMIIERLVEAMPRVATALALQMPKVALALVTGIGDALGDVINKILNKVSGGLLGGDKNQGAGGKILGGLAGSGIGTLIAGPVGAAAGLVKGLFADGSDRIPPGYNNDNFLAGLSSGEKVLSAPTTDKFENFIDKQTSGNNRTDELLAAMMNKMQNQKPPQFKVVISGREFAGLMLDARRSNQRI